MAPFFGFLGSDPYVETARLRREVALLQAQVDLLARRASVDLRQVVPPSPVSESVERLIRDGKTIAAIKTHREETGLGLAEAKADVDEASRRLR